MIVLKQGELDTIVLGILTIFGEQIFYIQNFIIGL